MSAVNVENRTTEWCNVSVNIAPYLELSFRKSPQLHNAAVAGDDKATAYFKQHQLSISSRNTNGIAFSWKIGMMHQTTCLVPWDCQITHWPIQIPLVQIYADAVPTQTIRKH